MNPNALRVLGVVCLVSIAFNLFGLGVLSARFFHTTPPTVDHKPASLGAPIGPPMGPRGRGLPGPPGLPGLMLAQLSDAERSRIAGIRKSHAQDIRSTLESRLTVQERLAELLRERDLDEAAISNAFAELRTLDNQAAEDAQEMLLEMALALEPESRHRLARWMQTPLRRPQQMFGGPGGPHHRTPPDRTERFTHPDD